MKSKLKGRALILFVAVFVLLLFLHSMEILNPFEKIILSALTPVNKIFYGAGRQTSAFFQNFIAKNKAGESDILKAQIRSLRLQIAQLKILSEENELLKKELGFSRNHPYELVAARLIGYDAVRTSDLFILQIENEKYKDGDIEIDMPVVIEDGVLIGKIAEIKNGQIFMRLITSPQSAVAATVLNKNYTTGVAEGESNSGVRMSMIPQSENIKQGDLIVSSGLETKIPRGLLVGTVSKMEHDPQNPFDIAYVTPLYNNQDLSKIMIIKAH